MFNALPTLKEGQLLCDYAKHQVKRQYLTRYLKESGRASSVSSYARGPSQGRDNGDHPEENQVTPSSSAPIFNPHGNIRKALERDEKPFNTLVTQQRQKPPSRGKRSGGGATAEDALSTTSNSFVSQPTKVTRSSSTLQERQKQQQQPLFTLTDDELADITAGIAEITVQIAKDMAQLRQWLFGGLPNGLGAGVAMAASATIVKDVAFFRDKREQLGAMAGRSLDAIATLESEDSVHLFSFAVDCYDEGTSQNAGPQYPQKDHFELPSPSASASNQGAEQRCAQGIPSTSLLLFSGDAVRLSFAFFMDAAHSIRQLALSTNNLVSDLDKANGGAPSTRKVKRTAAAASVLNDNDLEYKSPVLVPHANPLSAVAMTALLPEGPAVFVGGGATASKSSSITASVRASGGGGADEEDPTEHFNVSDTYLSLLKNAEAIYEHPFSFLDSTGCRHKLAQPEYLDALRTVMTDAEAEVVRLEKIQSTLTENCIQMNEAKRQRDKLIAIADSTEAPPTPPPPPVIVYEPPLEQFAYLLQVVRLYYICSLFEDEGRTVNFFDSTTTMMKVQLAHVQSLMNENRAAILKAVEKRHKVALVANQIEVDRRRAAAEAAGEVFHPSGDADHNKQQVAGDVLYPYYTEDEKNALQCTFQSFADLRTQLLDLNKRIETDIKKKNKSHGIAYTGGTVNNSALGRGCISFARPKDKGAAGSFVGTIEAGCFGGSTIPTTTALPMNTVNNNNTNTTIHISSAKSGQSHGATSPPALNSPPLSPTSQASPAPVEKADPASWGGWFASLPGKAIGVLFCSVDPAVVEAQRRASETKKGKNTNNTTTKQRNRFVSPAVYEKEHLLSEVIDLLLVCESMEKVLLKEYPTLYGRSWRQTIGAAMGSAAESVAKGAEYVSVVFGGPHYYSIGREERLGGRSPVRTRSGQQQKGTGGEESQV